MMLSLGLPAGLDPAVLERAKKVFPTVLGFPVYSQQAAEYRCALNSDLKAVVLVVDALFKHEHVRCEVSAGTFLEKAEAYGYLLSDLLGRGVLPHAVWAYAIGKRAGTRLQGAQGAPERARLAGKAARKGKPLERRDDAAAAARTQVWTEPYHRLFGELKLPPVREPRNEPPITASPATASQTTAESTRHKRQRPPAFPDDPASPASSDKCLSP